MALGSNIYGTRLLTILGTLVKQGRKDHSCWGSYILWSAEGLPLDTLGEQMSTRSTHGIIHFSKWLEHRVESYSDKKKASAQVDLYWQSYPIFFANKKAGISCISQKSFVSTYSAKSFLNSATILRLWLQTSFLGRSNYVIGFGCRQKLQEAATKKQEIQYLSRCYKTIQNHCTSQANIQLFSFKHHLLSFSLCPQPPHPKKKNCLGFFLS